MSDIEQSEENMDVRIFIITTNDEAARLIGSRGATVTNLRQEFRGITLKIGDKVPGVDEQVTEVKGPTVGVLELLMKIAEIIVEPRGTDDPLLTFLVHNTGGLIGTRGKRVTKIREESGATVKIADGKLGMSSQSAVTVSGKIESVEKATKRIIEFVSECEPVDIVYSPEMVSGTWGGPNRRGEIRRRGGRRGRGNGWINRNAGRFGVADWGGGDNSIRGDWWGNRRGGSRGVRWGSRDRLGVTHKDKWGARIKGDSIREDYDPFEPLSSRRSFHKGRDEGPPNNGWMQRRGRGSLSNWGSSNSERGWGKSSSEDRGWGPSSVGGRGGRGWGKTAGRGRNNYRGRRSRGSW